MTLNDRNAPPCAMAFFIARCVEANEDRLSLSAPETYFFSVDFSDVHIVHKFAG